MFNKKKIIKDKIKQRLEQIKNIKYDDDKIKIKVEVESINCNKSIILKNS